MALDDTKIRKQEKEETSKLRTENRTTHIRKQKSINTNQDRHCIPKFSLRRVRLLSFLSSSVWFHSPLSRRHHDPKQRTDDWNEKEKIRPATGEKYFEESTSFISFFVCQWSKHVTNLDDKRIRDVSVRTNTNAKIDDEKGGVDIITWTMTQKVLQH